ncbi:BrnA antitoxin family protein [Nostoc sp.]|uniref:BrnA antitoxin family protein n=1 Tax=Nostoc sp. TaxID=1180 RepID=UPI002FF6A85E
MSVNDLNNTSRTDWATLEAMTDEDIDYSDIPPLSDEFFENATLRIPATQARDLIELDSEVITWFREQGAEYKTLINSVLRRYIENSRDHGAG